MRKLLIFLTSFLAFTSSLSAGEVFLDTSFEEFPVGKLPVGFRILYDGMGAEYQIVTDKKAYSGEKSFQVWGTNGWCANVDYDFNVFKHRYVEVSYKMFATEDNQGWIHFINDKGDTWGWGYCGVGFSPKNGTFRICYHDNGNYKCDYFTKDKIPVKIDDWNDIKLLLDTKTTRCVTYLNNHKLYESYIDFDDSYYNFKYYFLNGTTKKFIYKVNNPKAFYGLHGITLGDCPGEDGSNKDATYFDDLKIVGYDSPPPELEGENTENVSCLTEDFISSLPSGWSNIGTPCKLDESDIEKLFSQVKYIWVWDKDKKLWKFWSSNKTLMEKASFFGIERLNFIDKFSGIWVFK